MRTQSTCFFVILIILLRFIGTYSQSIVNTPHNLSATGSGTIRATNESEICIFCHTPHSSSPQAPLWNRNTPGQHYALYQSSTIQASAGQPDGASILCLSCHDGTIALGLVLSRDQSIDMTGGTTVLPGGSSNLSTDLSDDHPVSFIYNSSLAASDGELVDPAGLSVPIHLDDQKLQCTACHDPHNNSFGNFLVASTQHSDLCLYCHQKNGWAASEHSLSPAIWNGSGSNPWQHAGYNTVSENGCENCHQPHNAGGAVRLTLYLPEENNCLQCHNGNVASTDIQSDLNKTYRHDVYSYAQLHDPEESALVNIRHVECTDCHNPHAVNSSGATAPDAGGKISGVPGIDSQGNAVASIRYEYELCYRCHADSPDKPGSHTSRQIYQTNVRLEFNPSNPSFHPVENSGRNSYVPSLISPLSESSIIYCTDCHASNNSSANGPHGSVYSPILKYRYLTGDYTSESYQAYELCYQCHDRNAIVNNGSTEHARQVHRKHIVDVRTPCNVCHDPHGVQGHSHLINFNTSVVSKSTGRMGRLEFIDDGTFAGRCYLNCHGWNHNPRSYN
ncbi:hypothetical protein JXJ21_07345 [candidate division KSB1 bacterium]|nr:hypothetical protein [candidate division KSB1 bacterium]